MKKTIILLGVLMVLGLGVWLFIERLTRVVPALNTSSPRLESINGNSCIEKLKVSDLRGKYVLVNFWDSSSAMSRIAAGEYDRFVRSLRNTSSLRLLSINTDHNRNLFNEIVRADGLDSLSQYHIADVKTRGITPDFHPEDGYSSYLIDPQGNIVAVNPTIATIEKIIGQNSRLLSSNNRI